MERPGRRMPFLSLSGAGCLLPFLIGFNFIFGLLFFNFYVWFTLEAILISLFLLQVRLAVLNLARQAQSRRGGSEVIDVEAKVHE